MSYHGAATIDPEKRAEFGKWLNKTRKERKLTLRAIAEPAGLSAQALFRIERGEITATPALIDSILTLLPELDRAETYFRAGRVPDACHETFWQNWAWADLAEAVADWSPEQTKALADKLLAAKRDRDPT